MLSWHCKHPHQGTNRPLNRKWPILVSHGQHLNSLVPFGYVTTTVIEIIYTFRMTRRTYVRSVWWMSVFKICHDYVMTTRWSDGSHDIDGQFHDSRMFKHWPFVPEVQWLLLQFPGFLLDPFLSWCFLLLTYLVILPVRRCPCFDN